jgi:hypothetical protein
MSRVPVSSQAVARNSAGKARHYLELFAPWSSATDFLRFERYGHAMGVVKKEVDD